MFDKLEAVEKRYEEVAQLLTDPDVIGRRQEFQKLSKEHAEEQADEARKIIEANADV